MFTRTRIHLTVIYTLIIMGISLFFSTAIYRIATFEINRVESRIRERTSRGMMPPPPVLANQEILEEAKARIVYELLIINLVILAGSSALSFWLSGLTLRPIHESMECQRRFISDASHELKTPIASIKTGLEVYLRSKKTSLVSATLLIQDTLVDINHLDNLTRQLLLLNSPNSATKTKIKPAEIAELITKKLQPLSDKKNLKIDKKLSQDTLSLNAQALEQILIILLDNAIKFSPPSGTISINSSRNILQISNQGPGIKKVDLPHIFDRFYQAETARTKTTTSGHGLGLSIARQLCDQNGWDISATSTPGKGATFTLRL